MPQLEENYIATGKIVYIFYQLPLDSLHPNARVSAAATECAGVQGKFWEMHDQVFLGQSEWSSSADAKSIFLTYATTLKLDAAAYTACLNEDQMAAKVQRDAAFAAGVGITGTPFFVVNQNGTLYAINGAQPYENLQQGLDSLLGAP